MWVKPLYFLVLPAALLLQSGCQRSSSGAGMEAEAQSEAAGPWSDELLLTSTKVGLPPAGVTAADLPDPGSPGATLLASHCAQCHELPSPTMHSATDWPSVARRMWLRMGRVPAQYNIQVPDAGARSTMLAYLTANALQVSGASLPEGPGRAEFSEVCSRCHTLPDPKVHSSQDWLAVFLRMERNMERMNVKPPTKEETSAILSYLQNQ